MWAVIVIVFLFFYLITLTTQRPPAYPPGPGLLPFIGNILTVWYNHKKLKYRHKVWQTLSQKYGDILGLQLGSINVVVVSGKDYIKEISSREVFEGRPDGFFYLMRSFGKKLGIVFADGPYWNKRRRTVLKYLKHYGYGSKAMEAQISEECQALTKLIENSAGRAICVNKLFNVCIVNVVWRLVAGKRYELTDERLKSLCDLITRSFKVVDMSGGVLNFLPFLRHIIPDLIGYTELMNINHSIYAYLKEVIEEHRTNLDDKNPRDVIDAFLIEMKNQEDKTLTAEELQVVCLDLLEAGVETVSNTAVFLLLYVVREQRVQDRLQMEIDKEIGHSRLPALSDRSKLIYTEAVLLEALRISTIAAMGIPHMALEDAKLGKYIIPKGTFLLLAFYDLHNGKHWKDPTVFRPERFLTKEGNLIQDDWLMPFGTGRRRCIGEGLARSELFLFLTHILQKFRLKVPEGTPQPSTVPIEGVTLTAQEFNIIFEPRY
ncbi:putative cytochrome P450 305a1 [Papilio machaon]|uniref:Putative cytochrome P450 305a1 n=1 Tax=Papilio machaon TaxID=76193 RepID=A0A194QQB1_PAPMA|nr:putative cytochrome P450 305a1 [Papilio machaon]